MLINVPDDAMSATLRHPSEAVAPNQAGGS
jgi:hypothetical protein